MRQEEVWFSRTSLPQPAVFAAGELYVVYHYTCRPEQNSGFVLITETESAHLIRGAASALQPRTENLASGLVL